MNRSGGDPSLSEQAFIPRSEAQARDSDTATVPIELDGAPALDESEACRATTASACDLDVAKMFACRWGTLRSGLYAVVHVGDIGGPLEDSGAL